MTELEEAAAIRNPIERAAAIAAILTAGGDGDAGLIWDRVAFWLADLADIEQPTEEEQHDQ